MTAQIEDDVRTLLADSVSTSPDNPERVAAVRGRVAGIRRRRVAGLAGGLAALTAIGVLGAGPVARLSHPDPRPSALAAPPYFDRSGVEPVVSGYEPLASGLLNGEPRRFGALWAPDGRSYLLVVHCAEPGILTVTNQNGLTYQVPCYTKVGDGYEGALALTSVEGTVLLQGYLTETGPISNLTVEPGTAGLWAFGLLVASGPNWLPMADVWRTNRYNGWERAATGTFTVTPVRGQVSWTAECVDGVVLTFRTAAGALLASAGCTGSIDFHFSLAEAAGPGARDGRPVRITVQRTGRDTNQWLIR
ncbi:MAG TPA: hypothetical protein VMU51_23730 [Mycobacteriales bacterium]|nr:hypothetical protein [Mycobacteriales bacterium]